MKSSKTPVSAWLMLLISIIALWFSTESFITVISTVAVLIVPSLYEKNNPSAASQRNSGFAGIAASLILPLQFKDRLAVLVAVAVMHAFRYSVHRPVLASLAIIIVAGTTQDLLLYGVLSVLWFILFIIFFYNSCKHHNKLSLRTIIIPIIFILIGLPTIWSLPIVAQGLIDFGVRYGSSTGGGFGAISNLNGITTIQQSSALALRLFGKSPRMLRGQVYRMYKNGKWYASGSKPRFLIGYIEDKELREERNKGSETIQIISGKGSGIWLPIFSELADVPAIKIERNSLGAVYSIEGGVTEYTYFPLSTILKTRKPITKRQVTGGTAHPLEFLASLSGKDGSKLREIAQKWTKESNSDYDKIQELMKRLGKEYPYSLSPNTPDDGTDPILHFLTESKQGHCELFASALVLLARSLKIPAKYVTGFSVSESSAVGNYFTGRFSDAHAWAEIYIEGKGWQTFDPTPSSWKQATKSAPIIFIRDIVDHLWYVFIDVINYLQNMYDDLEKQDNDEFTWLPYVMIIMALISLKYFVSYSKSNSLSSLFGWLSSKISILNKKNEQQLNVFFTSFENKIEKYGLKRYEWQSIGQLKTQINSTGLSEEGKTLCDEFLTDYEKLRYGLSCKQHQNEGDNTIHSEKLESMNKLLSIISIEIDKSLKSQKG